MSDDTGRPPGPSNTIRTILLAGGGLVTICAALVWLLHVLLPILVFLVIAGLFVGSGIYRYRLLREVISRHYRRVPGHEAFVGAMRWPRKAGTMTRMLLALSVSVPGFLVALFLITHYAHLGRLTTPFLVLVAVGWAAYILAATFLAKNGGTRR